MNFDYKAFKAELIRRGWQGIEGINSMGKCHLNEQHWLLTTDGLIIYSSIPFYTSVRYFNDEMEECWDIGGEFGGSRNLFSWEKLDMIIKLMDEYRAIKKL